MTTLARVLVWIAIAIEVGNDTYRYFFKGIPFHLLFLGLLGLILLILHSPMRTWTLISAGFFCAVMANVSVSEILSSIGTSQTQIVALYTLVLVTVTFIASLQRWKARRVANAS